MKRIILIIGLLFCSKFSFTQQIHISNERSMIESHEILKEDEKLQNEENKTNSLKLINMERKAVAVNQAEQTTTEQQTNKLGNTETQKLISSERNMNKQNN